MVAAVSELSFDNRFTAELPADPLELNRPRQVYGSAYSRVAPTPVSAPRLLAVSAEMLAGLDLDPEAAQSAEFAAVMSGNAAPDAGDPHAACYGGHQFGNWAGQLGDGRAITLGEVVASDGRRHTLQLKGSGPTPYSRTADGLAVLRSSVREFLCSEAMHHLGVPTTRALSLMLTGEQVLRDMFYDGRPESEPGAVVCRVAPSFIRFGSFEIFAARQDVETMRALADHTIATHFADICEAGPNGFGVDAYAEWFAEVARRTADMIVGWQRVGFVHGVMNTDNMSIHGLTIDYGPYGWLEDYDPGWTPNTTDRHLKRYRFGAQPHIAQWNLTCLANAIAPLTADAEALRDGLKAYVERFNAGWLQMMAAKLGIVSVKPEHDRPLVSDLLELLGRIETDMTLFFRALAELELNDGSGSSDGSTGRCGSGDAALLAALRHSYYEPDLLSGEVAEATLSWLGRYRSRIRQEGRSDPERRRMMNAVNPKYVLRNYLAQLAIDQATQGDPSLITELLDVLRRPYEDQGESAERFAAKRPEWARSRPGCSMLSCSS